MKSDFFKDLSFSSATAGFVAVLVACTSSVAMVFTRSRRLVLTMLLAYLTVQRFWSRVAVPATLVVAITFVAT